MADDEPDMLRFLKSQLITHYNVVEATDCLQASQKAPQVLPDIILLDMNMPEKDGLQVCRELRQHPSTQNIPIIVLTARADEATKLSALSAGANDFLTKPFSTSELHVRVRNLVESHQYRERLARQKKTLEKTIDQLKETETMLVQTEKMASLGRMSAGIIHEINNPLNYATTGLYTLRAKSKHIAPDQQAEYSEVLQEVEEGIGRVKSIVSDLKTFTHPDTEQKDNIDARTIVDLALRFLSNEWKDKLVIEQKLPERLCIHGNRNKLLQVFVNLFQNSLDAVRRKTFLDEKPVHHHRGPRGKRQDRHRHRCATTARASTPRRWAKFSIRFSPPRTSAKAWALASPSVTASFRNTKAASRSRASAENSANSRWNSPTALPTRPPPKPHDHKAMSTETNYTKVRHPLRG